MNQLNSRLLCIVEFEVGDGIVPIGDSPFGDRRLGYITGGRIAGDRLSGEVLPGGGNWSLSGTVGEASVGTFDARSVWKAAGGGLIYVTYGGRSMIPSHVRERFATNEDVDPGEYYLRIAPVSETADPDLTWLNGVLTVGVGERTDFGVRHTIHEIL